MSMKAGYLSRDMRMLCRIAGVRSTEQSVGIIVFGHVYMTALKPLKT